MEWLKETLLHPATVESALVIPALVIALGLAYGNVSFRGIRLGVAGILFTGLAFGHFGLSPNPIVLGFTRELGLVLFVFAVGPNFGPGFFNALRSHGLVLNLLAVSVVLLGVLITSCLIAFGVVTPLAAVGLLCGATINTPSLAAAGQTLRNYPPNVGVAQRSLAQGVPNHPLAHAGGPLSDSERAQLFA